MKILYRNLFFIALIIFLLAPSASFARKNKVEEEITLPDGTTLIVQRNNRGKIIGKSRQKLLDLGLLQEYDRNLKKSANIDPEKQQERQTHQRKLLQDYFRSKGESMNEKPGEGPFLGDGEALRVSGITRVDWLPLQPDGPQKNKSGSKPKKTINLASKAPPDPSSLESRYVNRRIQISYRD